MMSTTAVVPTYLRNDQFTAMALQANAPWAEDAGSPKKPSPIGGSKEHFFHFLLGYLLPVVSTQIARNDPRFRVMDCGPVMTPILRETLVRLGYDFEVVGKAEIRHPVFVPEWDFTWHNSGAVTDACERVRAAWNGYACPHANCEISENLLLRRSASHVFYQGSGAEVPGYGTSRRSLVNLDEVSEYLTRIGIPNTVYEPGAHCLGCQIAAFGAAKKIIGVRGAEWANVVWSTPGLRVRVIDPNPPAHYLLNLLERLAIVYEFEAASGNEVHENPMQAARFFSDR